MSITGLPHYSYEFNGAPPQHISEERIRAVADRSLGEKCANFLEGMTRSKVFKVVCLTGATMLTVALAFHPVGWMAATLGISAALAKTLFTAVALFVLACGTLIAHKSSSTVTIELTAIPRLLKTAVGKTNYNEIFEEKGHKLILGAMPNALTDYDVIHDVIGGNGTVISVNEPQEREIEGFHVPFTDDDYEQEEITYHKIDAPDFVLVDQAKLNEGVDAIDKGLQKGNVYVHCRAGKGRSAMILAAYLIKHQNMSVEEACKLIKEKRPEAKAHDRIDGLVKFKDWLSTSTKDTPFLETLAAGLEARRNKKSNGRAKLTKAEVAAFYGKKFIEMCHQVEGMFRKRPLSR